MKQGVTYWLQVFDIDFFYAKIQSPGLIARQMKVIINFLALECFYLSFLNSFVHTKGKI